MRMRSSAFRFAYHVLSFYFVKYDYRMFLWKYWTHHRSYECCTYHRIVQQHTDVALMERTLYNLQFDATKPNEVWVSDVTYFKYAQTAYYICVIINLFSRMVVGYKVGKTNSTQLVKSTFRIAYNARQPDSHLISILTVAVTIVPKRCMITLSR